MQTPLLWRDTDYSIELFSYTFVGQVVHNIILQINQSEFIFINKITNISNATYSLKSAELYLTQKNTLFNIYSVCSSYCHISFLNALSSLYEHTANTVIKLRGIWGVQYSGMHCKRLTYTFSRRDTDIGCYIIIHLNCSASGYWHTKYNRAGYCIYNEHICSSFNLLCFVDNWIFVVLWAADISEETKAYSIMVVL